MWSQRSAVTIQYTATAKGDLMWEGGAVQVLYGGWGWVKWGRHLIAQLLHVLRVPTAHPQAAHTAFTLVWHIHAPNRHKSQLLHTLPRKLRPTNARAGTYSPASQGPSLFPIPTNTLYTFSYAKCCLSAYAGKREREKERELEKCVFTKFPSFVCDL